MSRNGGRSSCPACRLVCHLALTCGGATTRKIEFGARKRLARLAITSQSSIRSITTTTIGGVLAGDVVKSRRNRGTRERRGTAVMELIRLSQLEQRALNVVGEVDRLAGFLDRLLGAELQLKGDI